MAQTDSRVEARDKRIAVRSIPTDELVYVARAPIALAYRRNDDWQVRGPLLNATLVPPR